VGSNPTLATIKKAVYVGVTQWIFRIYGGIK